MSLRRIITLLGILLGIALPISLGLLVRFDDLKVWKANKELYFYDDKPLFTSYDAFYFALWSKEYLEGHYRAREEFPLRLVPDGSKYPDPIPLESWMTAQIVRATGSSIEEVALWLTPVLSVLVVIPLFLYFYRLGYPLAGFSGALLTVLSLAYLIRTSIVRFDTDSLNLFFPFAIAYSLFMSLESSGRWRYFWVVAAGLLSQLYYWWYLHSGLILVLVPFYLLALFLNRKIDSQDKIKLFLIFLVAANPIILVEGLWNLAGSLKTYLIKYFRPQVGGFPNVQHTISELKHFSLYKLSTFASGSFPLFAVGFAGFLLFLLKRWRELVLLFPPFLIGLISFVGGNRFVMYLAPFIGVGFGYLLDRAVNLFSKRAVFLSLGAVVAFLLIVFSNLSSFRFVAQPKITPALAAEFSRLPTCTLSGSWVWTWWDYGTAILYYARRGVYHDPQSFGTPKTYFVARSFVEDSPERAYNAILGVSNLGAEGIKELLEKGLSAKEVVNLVLSGRYSKPLGRPIYWLFSQDELLKYPAISYIGSWFKDGREKGRFFTFLPRICSKVSRGYSCGGWFLDPNKGVLVVPSNGKGFREIPLKRVVILKRDGQPLKEVLYDRSASLSFEVVSLGRNLSYGILLDEEAFKSMFNQMFVLRRYDRRLFTLVKNDFPVLVLYKVKD